MNYPMYVVTTPKGEVFGPFETAKAAREYITERNSASKPADERIMNGAAVRALYRP